MNLVEVSAHSLIGLCSVLSLTFHRSPVICIFFLDTQTLDLASAVDVAGGAWGDWKRSSSLHAVCISFFDK